MDCDTARLFLQLCRPGHDDLDGPEAGDLDDHLAHCSACNQLVLTQQRLDAHLGRAMRAVEPPAGLRERILDRLATQRHDRHRRWLAHGSRLAAAAAAVVLLIAGGWYYLYARPLSAIDTGYVQYSQNVTERSHDRANQLLKQLGARACAPAHFDYGRLIAGPSLAILPGYDHEKVQVPQFVFASQNGKQLAIVYVIDTRRHRIDEAASDHGYTFRLAVHRPPGRYAYLVFHNGKGDDDWRRWLCRPEPDEP